MANNHGVTFLYPVGDNLTFWYLDTIDVTYDSPFASPILYTFCDGGNNNIRFQPATPYNGTTSVLLNWTSTTPCYFDLRPDTNPGHGANSDSFTLEVDVKSQTTAGLAEAIPATSSSTSTTSSSTTLTTTTTSSSSTSSAAVSSATSGAAAVQTATAAPSSGLSTGAMAGIGVGVALGVILLATALGAWLLHRRRKRRSAGGPAEIGAGTPYQGGPGGPSGPPAPIYEANGPVPALEADAGMDWQTYKNGGLEHKYMNHKPHGDEMAMEQKAAWLPDGMAGRPSEMGDSPAPQELGGREIQHGQVGWTP